MLSFQAILISRFLINLRRTVEVGSTNTTSQFTTPNFRAPTVATILGNLGEPLEPGENDEEAQDENADRMESLPSASADGLPGTLSVEEVRCYATIVRT